MGGSALEFEGDLHDDLEGHDLAVVDLDFLFFDQAPRTLRSVCVARSTPSRMASSKLISDRALISVTRATACMYVSLLAPCLASQVVRGVVGKSQWLTSMQVVDHPFEGYQHTRAYRMRRDSDDEGVPVSRMAVRPLLVPPGVPDFLTRRRFVERGEHELEGRAWSGHGPIATVEVSVDAGASWQVAELEPSADPAAWTRWSFLWVGEEPGETQVRIGRSAHDSGGQRCATAHEFCSERPWKPLLGQPPPRPARGPIRARTRWGQRRRDRWAPASICRR